MDYTTGDAFMILLLLLYLCFWLNGSSFPSVRGNYNDKPLSHTISRRATVLINSIVNMGEGAREGWTWGRGGMGGARVWGHWGEGGGHGGEGGFGGHGREGPGERNAHTETWRRYGGDGGCGGDGEGDTNHDSSTGNCEWSVHNERLQLSFSTTYYLIIAHDAQAIITVSYIRRREQNKL